MRVLAIDFGTSRIKSAYWDEEKGEAVMLVATEGSMGAAPKAITLLSGVETILTASPNGSGAAMLLSPWNMPEGLPSMRMIPPSSKRWEMAS